MNVYSAKEIHLLAEILLHILRIEFSVSSRLFVSEINPGVKYGGSVTATSMGCEQCNGGSLSSVFRSCIQSFAH